MAANSKGTGKYKKMSMSAKEYQSFAKIREPSRPALMNSVRAFLVGGFICLIGQAIQELFVFAFDMTQKEAGNPTVAILIFVSVILTCLGVYDKIAQWAGAGTAVPVTGFANSMCSAALEHRSEGLVLGVGGNMFKLAGSVIVFGTVAAFIVGIVYWIFGIFTFDGVDGLMLAEWEEGRKTEAALGIIAAGKCPSALLLRLQAAGLPLVLVDHEEPVLAADCVLNANVEAGRMACRHLLAQDCRSLAFVGELGFAVSFRERFWGCRLAFDDLQEAWRARGREAASAALRSRPDGKDDLQLRRWTIPYGRRPWDAILDKKLAAALAERALPDGFVCANDDIALKLLELLSSRGINAPADCRVIGIDNTAAGQQAEIPLTTVDLAKERLGMRAVETLVRRRSHPEALPEKVVLSARLIVRQSG